MSRNIEMTMIVISDGVLYCIVWIFWWTRIFVVYNTVPVVLDAIIIVLQFNYWLVIFLYA